MICPRCQTALSNQATACDCGWRRPKAEATERRDVLCAFDGCPHPATVRFRTGARKSGVERHSWANVCERHDIELATRDAKEWLGQVGLVRQQGESMRAWMTRTIAWLRSNAENKPRARGMRRVGDYLAMPNPRAEAEAKRFDAEMEAIPF